MGLISTWFVYTNSIKFFGFKYYYSGGLCFFIFGSGLCPRIEVCVRTTLRADCRNAVIARWIVATIEYSLLPIANFKATRGLYVSIVCDFVMNLCYHLMCGLWWFEQKIYIVFYKFTLEECNQINIILLICMGPCRTLPRDTILLIILLFLKHFEYIIDLKLCTIQHVSEAIFFLY